MLSSLISDIVSAFTIAEVDAEAPAPEEEEDKQVEQKKEEAEAPAEIEEEEAEEPEDILPKLQEGKSIVPEDWITQPFTLWMGHKMRRTPQDFTPGRWGLCAEYKSCHQNH